VKHLRRCVEKAKDYLSRHPKPVEEEEEEDDEEDENKKISSSSLSSLKSKKHEDHHTPSSSKSSPPSSHVTKLIASAGHESSSMELERVVGEKEKMSSSVRAEGIDGRSR